MSEIKPTDADVARFWANVQKTDNCWLWTGLKDVGGYGRFFCKAMHPKRARPAHRFSFQLHVRQLAPDECVMHSCDVPACVNPAHLRADTVAENNADMFRKRRAWQCRVTRCPKGHEYTPANTLIGKRGNRACAECQRLRQSQRNETTRRWRERKRLIAREIRPFQVERD